MEKKIIILFSLVFMLLAVQTISAAPPFQTSDKGIGLEVRFPQGDNLMLNKGINYHVHVFNATNGLPVGSPTVSCTVHLYNSNGSHSLERVMDYDSNNMDFKLDITGANFSTVQRMSGITWCNSTTEGGFASFGFDVTYSGRSISEAQSLLYIPLFLVFFSLFIVGVFGINRLPDSNARDEEGKLLNISYLKYLRSTLWFILWGFVLAVIFISSNISRAYLPDTLISEFMLILYRIFLGLTPLVIFIWLFWIIVKIMEDKQLNNMLRRGLFKPSL